jgi:hypothetical protein
MYRLTWYHFVKGDKWEVEQEYNFFAREDEKCIYLNFWKTDTLALFLASFVWTAKYILFCSLSYFLVCFMCPISVAQHFFCIQPTIVTPQM